VAGGGFFTETLVLMSQSTMNKQDIGVERGGASPTSQTNYSHTERVDLGLDHPQRPTQVI
jgi:hypothetical protein